MGSDLGVLGKRIQTYVECARDLEKQFSRWCIASGVQTFEVLCNLMILEQLKNCLAVLPPS